MQCKWLKNKGKSICIGSIYVEDGYLVFNGQETVKFKLSEEDKNNKFVESFIESIESLTGRVTIWYDYDTSRIAYNGDIVDFQVYEDSHLVKGLMIDYIK